MRPGSRGWRLKTAWRCRTPGSQSTRTLRRSGTPVCRSMREAYHLERVFDFEMAWVQPRLQSRTQALRGRSRYWSDESGYCRYWGCALTSSITVWVGTSPPKEELRLGFVRRFEPNNKRHAIPLQPVRHSTEGRRTSPCFAWRGNPAYPQRSLQRHPATVMVSCGGDGGGGSASAVQ
jgi:hypothetical protein